MFKSLDYTYLSLRLDGLTVDHAANEVSCESVGAVLLSSLASLASLLNRIVKIAEGLLESRLNNPLVTNLIGDRKLNLITVDLLVDVLVEGEVVASEHILDIAIVLTRTTGYMTVVKSEGILSLAGKTGKISTSERSRSMRSKSLSYHLGNILAVLATMPSIGLILDRSIRNVSNHITYDNRGRNESTIASGLVSKNVATLTIAKSINYLDVLTTGEENVLKTRILLKRSLEVVLKTIKSLTSLLLLVLCLLGSCNSSIRGYAYFVEHIDFAHWNFLLK
ncbi:MAG: hypothetical protein IJ593_02205 [Lachnospiraceae bacterium]|nr:hypothetical protein [Lachnospiraceae bacterium]